jgi:two-component system response regulator MprA
MTELSVLVVDDDPSIRTLLEEVLRDEGYVVRVAANGREALEYLNRDRPALILLDLMMPEMDGRQFCRAIAPRQQSAEQRVPVMVITADRASREEVRSLGVDSYVTKPFDLDTLLTEVARLTR